MKAMIFAAGLGTRLKPLTNDKPKALVEVGNTPLIEMVILKLIRSGFDEIIINVHHFADMIVEFLKKKNNFNIRIEISDEKDLLLDTGGGLKKANWFFDDGKPFLVYNVDIFSDIDLGKLYTAHLSSNAIATVAVRNRSTSRYLLFDDNNQLCGWENTKTGEQIISRQTSSELHPFANSGVQIIDPKVFQHMPDKKVFSIISFYLQIAPEFIISAFLHNDSYWLDLGKKEKILEAEKIILS